MLQRILDRYRRYRLLLLLSLLGLSTLFSGNSCFSTCTECTKQKIHIGYSGDQVKGDLILVEAGHEYEVPVELVVNSTGVTVSNVSWKITDPPGVDLIKKGGAQIYPSSGEQVTLKLAAQDVFGKTGDSRMEYIGLLFSGLRIQADFQSTPADDAGFRTKYVGIWAAPPYIEVDRLATADYACKLLDGIKLKGRRDTVFCAGLEELPGGVSNAIMSVYIDLLSEDRPFQFFATVPPSKRQYLTVNRIESVDPRNAKIYLTFSQGGAKPNMTIYFPLYLSASGAGDRVINEVVDIELVF